MFIVTVKMSPIRESCAHQTPFAAFRVFPLSQARPRPCCSILVSCWTRASWTSSSPWSSAGLCSSREESSFWRSGSKRTRYRREKTLPELAFCICDLPISVTREIIWYLWNVSTSSTICDCKVTLSTVDHHVLEVYVWFQKSCIIFLVCSTRMYCIFPEYLVK